MGVPDDEIMEPSAATTGPDGAEADAESAEDAPVADSEALKNPPIPPWSPLVVLAVVAALLVAVWLLSGFTTSSDAVCMACHVSTVHKAAKSGEDPHGSAACVSCHEPGGVAGRYFTAVPSRMLHFLDGAAELSVQADYGRVASSSCIACHSRDIKGVTVNKVSGVRMSHVEPLAASATCLDCHTPLKGVVSRQTVGMRSCLRCHDAVTASSECSTCHDKQAAAAARANSTAFARPQVTDVRCGGCHDEKKECDSCHGTRMPHTLAFKAGAHARAAAVDIWYNGGKTCSGCHTATRRPCTKCHTELMGKAHGTNQATDHRGASAAACDRCHITFANPRGRDFCGICHLDAAKKESPR